ncbi:hypothetical protein GGF40_002227 [Coemansia sp. RSA 1286]|nr:hypothetical protein GGF40_002227 [Coemansia sp. RSA 1286]
MSNPIEATTAFVDDSSDAGTGSGHLQLYQAVPMHLDNLYPYTGKQPFHIVPSPEDPLGKANIVYSDTEKLARHLEGDVMSALYTLRSHPDTCIQWRLLADRRTLELRTLRWVNDGERDDQESSVVTSWHFGSELLSTVVAADREDGAVSVAVCGVDGVVYRLRFVSAWAIAATTDVSGCVSWYSLQHTSQAALFDGVDYRTMVVACADASVVWLNWRSDGSIIERVCSAAGSAQILPRVAAFLMLRRGKSVGGDSEPVALDVTRTEDIVVGATLGRDRRLRLWTSEQCAFDEVLPQVDTEGAAIPVDPHANAPCFDNGARAHVRIESVSNGICALVYVPDDAVPYFALIVADIRNDRLCNVRTVMRKICRAINGASALMADDELVDIRLANQSDATWTLWALWDRGQDTVVTYTHFSLTGEPLEFSGHDVYGERWFTTLQAPGSLKPTSDAPRIASIDQRIRAEDTQLQASDISRAFLDHVLHPSRFDHGVLSHALHLYEQSARGRGYDVCSSPEMPLRRRVASSVGSYLRAGNETRPTFLRQVYTEWMRYTTLCVRLQRAANTPVSLALCEPTQMVSVVGRSSISVLNPAEEPECLHALVNKDPAASVLLNASVERVAYRYPVLAQARVEIPLALAAAASLASALSPKSLVALTDDLAQDACSGETLVSHETRAVELFQLHCAPLTPRQLRHAAGLLRRCDDPARTLRMAMHILEQSVGASCRGGNNSMADQEMFCASATMTGLLAAVFAASTTARFELARNVSLLLVAAAACPDQVAVKDVPAALAAVQQIVCRFAVPQWLSSQATGANSCLDLDSDRPSSLVDDSDASSVDGFLRKFSVLNIERRKDPVEASHKTRVSDSRFPYSLLHDTLARAYSLHFSGGSGAFSAMISDGVQQIFASLGADDTAGSGDILFAANVERTQPPELADALLRQFPKSSAINYLTARAYLRLRDFNGASELFASAGIAYAQVADDLRDAVDLQFVLPEAVIDIAHAYAYYEHVAELFASSSDQEGVVRFNRLALQSLDSDAEGLATDVVKETRQKLWFRIFYAEIERNSFEPAYMAVMAQPDKSVQLDCLRHLISVLCERDQGISVLCRLTFPGLQEEIERTLLFKARHSDLLVPKPNYYKVLYSFHVYRGNYRNAASAMYQYARRLSTLMLTKGDVSELLVLQGQALLACINGLSLVDRQSAWVVVGRQSGGDLLVDGNESSDQAVSGKHKRRRIAIGRYDTSATTHEAQNIDIVDLADIRREYALCIARAALGTTFTELFARNLLFEPEDAVTLYIKTCNYDSAFSLAKTFDLKLDDIFAALVQKGVQLSSLTNSSKRQNKHIPDGFWKNAGLPSAGLPSERIWGLLRHYLDIEEPVNGNGDLRYRLLVAQAILQAEYDSPLAPWLSTHLLRRCPQDLIRLCLVNGCVTEGAGFLLQHVNSTIAKIASSETALCKNTREFWLPYQLIDQTVGILDDSVVRFEDAVMEIREARKSAGKGAKKLACLLKSYRERLDGLKGLRTNLKTAFDRYMVLAARESRDISEAAIGSVSTVTKNSVAVV